MSLGVLNNLSAMSAANNLNNTQNALSKTLQQLSSGSKINSGADDAAGLSLVNGLQANATALVQSQTNATEGVGLLTVADGALSQVTNLLNRAVTLATEVSNGTLNASQNTAANQEYQSILSEINNIGATTTYNQKTVFGSNTSIYTGDSSTQGASVNQLNIRSLSSSNVGDSAGQMAYSNGANNVFIDLSSAGHNAAVTDSLGTSSQTTTVAVNYMTKGVDGSAVSASANISVGAGTSFANSAQGLIDAINGAGLGLTATFGTATQAGSAAVSAAAISNVAGGSGTDTGIIVSGIGVGTGTNGAGEIGTLTTAANSDLLGGTLNITGSDGASHVITLGTTNSTDTLANLASTINAANYGVSATYNSASHNIVFNSANSAVSVSGTNLTDQTSAAAADTVTPVNTPTDYAASGTIGSLTVTNSTDVFTGGTLKIKGDDGNIIGGANGITLGVAGQTDTLANLANYINTNAAATDVTAALSANGKTVNFNAGGNGTTGTNTAVTWANLTALTPAVSSNIALTGTPTAANSAYGGVVGTMVLGGSATDTLTGTLNIGSAPAITLGTATGSNKTDTLAHLVSTINAGNYGVTASLNTAVTAKGNAIGTVMTLSSTNTAINVSGTNLADATTASAATLGTSMGTTIPIAVAGANSSITVSNANNILSGTLSGVDKLGAAYSIQLGQAGTTDTIANLKTYITNDTTLGMTAGGNATSITFTLVSGTPTMLATNVMQNTLASNGLTETTNAPYANQLGTLALSGAGTAAGDTLSAGTLKIGSGISITLGSVANKTDTLSNLATTINKLNQGVSASLDSTGKILTLSSTTAATAGLSVSGTGLYDATQGDTGMLIATTNTPAVDTSNYYSVGITAGAGGITDTSTGGGTANTGFSANNNGSGGLATISYSDSAGQSLAATDLANSTDARATLTALNSAIANLAAQDGYIGAQINTLNAVSSVMSTQQQNVVAAQNAVQATDYASAASNMSKYQILSQTGISALAQANSMQQEVLKLLQ